MMILWGASNAAPPLLCAGDELAGGDSASWQGVTLLVHLRDGVDQATAYLWMLWRNGHL